MAQHTEDQPTPARAPRAWRGLGHSALVVYLLLTGAYLFVIPPGEAPDERLHVACVRAIAETGRLAVLPDSPLARQQGRMVSDEAQQPPLYYVILTPVWLAVGGREAIFYPVARVLSILIGLGAILLTRRAVRTVLPDRPDVLALCTVFAGTFATYNYVMATINNEVPAVLVVALGLWFAARAVVAQRPLAPVLWLGAMIGLALLVKLTATCLLAVLIVVALAVTAREAGGRRWARALGLIAAAAGVAIAIGGWWPVRNALVYGEPVPRAHYRPNFWNVQEAFGLPELTGAWALSMTESAIRSVWSPEWLLRRQEVFATLLLARLVRVPAEAHNPVPTLLPLALLVLGIWGAARLLRGREADEDAARAPMWLLRAIAAAWVWLLLGLTGQTLFVDRHISLFVGRYLPVLLPSLGVVMGMGASRLLPERYRLPASVAVLVALVAYGVRVLLAVAVKHTG